MQVHNWTLRKVRPSTIRTLLRLISLHPDGAKWEAVLSGAMATGNLKENVSNARAWHYSSFLRCLELAETPSPGWYKLTPLGHRLLEEMGAGDTFSDTEITLLRPSLLKCQPCREFLFFFTGGNTVRDVESVTELGLPVYCNYQRSYGMVQNSFGQSLELRSRTEVNQWQDGLSDLCKQLRIVDELRLPPGAVEGIPFDHVMFVTGDQPVSQEWLDDILGSNLLPSANTGRVYIPRLIYQLATSYRIRVQELQDALMKYVNANRSKVYLDRVSELSVKKYQSSFLLVDGVWRSSIIYG